MIDWQQPIQMRIEHKSDPTGIWVDADWVKLRGEHVVACNNPQNGEVIVAVYNEFSAAAVRNKPADISDDLRQRIAAHCDLIGLQYEEDWAPEAEQLLCEVIGRQNPRGESDD